MSTIESDIKMTEYRLTVLEVAYANHPLVCDLAIRAALLARLKEFRAEARVACRRLRKEQ